jgi:hypothetical protein
VRAAAIAKTIMVLPNIGCTPFNVTGCIQQEVPIPAGKHSGRKGRPKRRRPSGDRESARSGRQARGRAPQRRAPSDWGAQQGGQRHKGCQRILGSEQRTEVGQAEGALLACPGCALASVAIIAGRRERGFTIRPAEPQGVQSRRQNKVASCWMTGACQNVNGGVRDVVPSSAPAARRDQSPGLAPSSLCPRDLGCGSETRTRRKYFGGSA